MNIKDRRWRPALRVLALAVAIAALPLPCLAEDSSPPAAKPGIQASMQRIIATTPQAPPQVQAVRSQGTTAAPGKASFFKSPAGLAVIAIVAGGTAYAVYSSRHDRIHSVIRSGQ